MHNGCVNKMGVAVIGTTVVRIRWQLLLFVQWMCKQTKCLLQFEDMRKTKESNKEKGEREKKGKVRTYRKKTKTKKEKRERIKRRNKTLQRPL